jgi:hypothetical protein
MRSGPFGRRVNRRLLIVSIAMLTIVGTAWAFANPRGRFGVCQYGVTTYGLLPLPFLDLQVGGDGTTRWVTKTHDIDGRRLEWLLSSRPDVLIVALGWSGAARLVSRSGSHVNGSSEGPCE